ncbi:pyridoxal phosphate-dependent transferase [Lobosporangium transversale]|uniref:Pyridoxal phosphate-dependent transferase n=1 Tax=Lobosporangium transversale TaxID=64571 RepID=A0A1Y2GXJ2_9FUNG|nr:pyridoxal phosphate-dependent transferase [Lobosporangium transversale]ORZ26996.1 pyridoxal phosphate-dependent transferase [Lobosporangium transversale]|eukprot:XP_021884743.1 pyridoxal phosphate-dependent transferase [Lobosporangium transversale]
MAKDFSSFLSAEGASRKKSPLKGLLRFMKGDMVSLGGGLPHPSTFPFYSLSAEIKSVAPTILNDTSGKTSSATSDLVTVPHGPQPGKVESLSASLQYGLGTGIKSLREFCKEHINQMHRPQYQDWDVLLSAGNTDSYSKAIAMLCNRGEKILVEEWTYPAALEMIDPLGVGHIPVTMDGEGMSAVALKDLLDNWGSAPDQAKEAKPRVVYVIPTGQNPTGSTMSIQRRRDIMRVAQEHNLIVIEDDPYYYLQFNVDNGWVPSLLSMDTDGRVIRLDTFSKTLAPGCRVGYMSMNAHFCTIVQNHNEVTTQQPSGFSQTLLAEMLVSHWGQEGYNRYLTENVRTEYLNRSRHLQACFQRHVNSKLATFIEPSAGMFIWIKIHLEHHPQYGTVSDSALMLRLFNKCIENNVLLVPGWQFSCKPKPADFDPADPLGGWFDGQATYLRATFAYASFEQMETAMIRFGESLNEIFSA